MPYKRGVFPDLTAILARKATKHSEEKIRTIEEIVRETSDIQQKSFFQTVAIFMGQYNKPDLPPFKKVVWKKLSKRTVGRKKSNTKWYSHLDKAKGEVSLRDFLKQEPVEAHYNKTKASHYSWDTARRKNYWKRIIVEPGLSGKRKPFTDSDNTLGMNREQETKVTAKNPFTGLSNEEARPLFRPMQEYFVRIRIPRAINRKLKEKGYNVKF